MAELQRLVDAAKDRWHTRTGFLLGLLTTVVILVAFFARVSLDEVTPGEWLIVVLVSGVLFLLWRRTRLPQGPRGAIGFGVALDHDDDARQLYTDFVLAVRDGIAGQHHVGLRLAFVEFPRRVASQLADADQAVALMQRTRVHFLLWGRVRKREMPGGPANVIDLKSTVRHATIEGSASQRFGKDIASVLPHRFFWNVKEPLIACEIAAYHVQIAAKYVIGSARLLSDDTDSAERLLLDAENQVQALLNGGDETSRTAVLLDRVRKRLGTTYGMRLNSLMEGYRAQKDPEILESVEALLPRMEEYDPGNYHSRQLGAMCHFMLRRDVAAAKELMEQCKGEKDSTWLYNLAFLEAYGGDLDEAYRRYSRAFREPLANDTVPVQVEEFMQLVLDEEPDRWWLLYCLGLVNYRAKQDFIAAKRDLEGFINRAEDDPGRFPAQLKSAKKWVSEIDASLA